MANLSSGCRKSGRCSCIHLYDDYTPVPGSGTSDDPYIHERPAVKCITRKNGTAIDYNATTGCFILPRHVTELVIDGRAYAPDLNGRVTLPSNLNIHLSAFKIRDPNSNVLDVTEGTLVNFIMDGDPTVGVVGNEYPVISGSSVVFPQMKVREIREDFNQTLIGTNSAGGISLNVTDGATVNLAELNFGRQKLTQYTLHLSLAIQENDASIAPGNGEYVIFKPEIVPDVTATGLSTIGELPALVWAPDNGYGHKRYSLSIGIVTSTAQSVSTAELKLTKLLSANLNGSRDIRCEFQAYLVSV